MYVSGQVIICIRYKYFTVKSSAKQRRWIVLWKRSMFKNFGLIVDSINQTILLLRCYGVQFEMLEYGKLSYQMIGKEVKRDHFFNLLLHRWSKKTEREKWKNHSNRTIINNLKNIRLFGRCMCRNKLHVNSNKKHVCTEIVSIWSPYWTGWTDNFWFTCFCFSLFYEKIGIIIDNFRSVRCSLNFTISDKKYGVSKFQSTN